MKSNLEKRTIIIAESNFLQETLYNIRRNHQRITDRDWQEINDRLQVIRDIARQIYPKSED